MPNSVIIKTKLYGIHEVYWALYCQCSDIQKDMLFVGMDFLEM